MSFNPHDLKFLSSIPRHPTISPNISCIVLYSVIKKSIASSIWENPPFLRSLKFLVITLKQKHEIGLFLLILNAYKNTKCMYHRTLSVTLYKQNFFLILDHVILLKISRVTVELDTCSVSHVHHSTEVTMCHSGHLASSNLRLCQLLDLIRCQKCDLELTKYHSHLIHNFMLLNFTF